MREPSALHLGNIVDIELLRCWVFMAGLLIVMATVLYVLCFALGLFHAKKKEVAQRL